MSGYSLEALLKKVLSFWNRTKVVVVETPGGLGNQILPVLLGIYCREVFKRSLRIDTTHLDERHSPGFNFLSLLWSGTITYRSNKHSRFRRLIWRIRDSLVFNSLFFRRLEVNLLGTHREVYSPITSLDDLARILASHKKVRFKGYYFQKAFAQELQSKGLITELQLATPSNEFARLERECLETYPIGIHIRRGDYSRESFGQLSENYYLKLLEEVDGAGQNPLWLFASTSKILDELPKLKSLASLVVTSCTLTNPAESMVLLSKCPRLVLSNSSFSYISGLFCKGKVYSPWPFRPEGSGLTPGIKQLSIQQVIPDHWKVFDSIWES